MKDLSSTKFTIFYFNSKSKYFISNVANINAYNSHFSGIQMQEMIRHRLRVTTMNLNTEALTQRYHCCYE